MIAQQIPVIDVVGTAFNVGRIHAEKTMNVRDIVDVNVAAAKKRYGSRRTVQKIAEITDVLRQYSPDTLDQIAGMASVYELDEKDMLVAVLQTYFEGLQREELLPDQGCSTYAYSSPEGAVLVKNRDTGITFKNAQTVLRVKEQDKYSWIALSTAGAPGVHSAGMNEHGLCIADTHVPSRDTGAGLPRFSMMMNMLQESATVAEARACYEAKPSMGYGNLILIDPNGDKLVIECGYRNSGFIESQLPHIVATNHFISDALKDSGLDQRDQAKAIETRERKRILSDTVARDLDRVLIDPKNPVSQHVADGPGSLCVHSDTSPTIATVVMDPENLTFGISYGNPCEGTVAMYSANPNEWI